MNHTDSPGTDADATALSLEANAEELAVLVGPEEVNRKLIEDLLGVRLVVRGGRVAVSEAQSEAGDAALSLVASLLERVRRGRELTPADIRDAARLAQRPDRADIGGLMKQEVVVTHRGKPLVPKTAGQARYVAAIASHDLTFCFGPAGTGKTYLAMGCAVAALKAGAVGRIVLTRPIVEAGEALGFLPGDMLDKVDPYLRPLHDALHDIMGAERFRRQLDRGTIEVIPLAYMRGRTLNNSFIVLDEAQNTTSGQMKMALTRLGFGSKMVVTGDVTQTDLPARQVSGLLHAMQVLGAMKGVAYCELTGEDIVRHDLVQRIVSAYDEQARKSELADEQAL